MPEFFSNLFLFSPHFPVVSCEGRRYCFPICLFFCSGLTVIVARHLCSDLDCCCFDLISQCQKNKMATSEKLCILPLWAASPSMRPVLPGLAMNLPSWTKFERCCLEFCELSRFSFPVKCEKENRCRLMRVWQLLIALTTLRNPSRLASL